MKIYNQMELKGMKSKSSLLIEVIDLANKKYTIQVPEQMTGFQLKQYIYANLTKELKAKQMTLICEGKQLTNNSNLSQFKIHINNKLIFAQNRINLGQVSGIFVQNIQDPLVGQKSTYQWPCGHFTGQLGIHQLMKDIIANKKSVIKCPYSKQNGESCGYQWDYGICKKIGLFTSQQKKYFEKTLTQSYIHRNFNKCPKCNLEFLNSQHFIRVRCPYCNYGDFCIDCQQSWSNPKSTTQCGNKQCNIYSDLLASGSKLFSVIEPKHNKIIQIKTPKYRACPNCFSIIQSCGNCKHYMCNICNTRFCWICLSVSTKQWSCGSYGEYCGKVAQVQKYKRRKY